MKISIDNESGKAMPFGESTFEVKAIAANIAAPTASFIIPRKLSCEISFLFIILICTSKWFNEKIKSKCYKMMKKI